MRRAADQIGPRRVTETKGPWPEDEGNGLPVDTQGDLVRWPVNEAEEIVASDQLDTPY